MSVIQLLNKRPYTIKEEIWNCVIHGLGIALSIAALTILVIFSSLEGNVWAVVSTSVFGTSMILLYSASTIYHAVSNPEQKKKLKKFDHISIYYLIAGSYTPFLLVNMRGVVGWTLFGIIWGLAILGTCLKLMTSGSGTKAWSIGLYILMGWMIIFASKELFANLSEIGAVFLILGGIFYTFGILFYIWKNEHHIAVVSDIQSLAWIWPDNTPHLNRDHYSRHGKILQDMSILFYWVLCKKYYKVFPMLVVNAVVTDQAMAEEWTHNFEALFGKMKPLSSLLKERLFSFFVSLSFST